MPEIIEKDGQQVEVYTKDEVEAAKTEGVKTLEAELNKAKEDLKKFENKDYNFKNVEEAKKAAEAQVEKLKEALTGELLKISDKVDNEKVNQMVTPLVGQDADTKKKVLDKYAEFKKPGDSDEVIAKKLRDAYISVMGTSPTDAIMQVVTAGGNGQTPPIVPNQNAKIKPELVPLANKFGLSNEDLKKYGAI